MEKNHSMRSLTSAKDLLQRHHEHGASSGSLLNHTGGPRKASLALPGVHQGNDFLLTADEVDRPNRRGGINAVSLMKHLSQEDVEEIQTRWGDRKLSKTHFVELMAPFVGNAGYFDTDGNRIESKWAQEGWISSTTRAAHILQRKQSMAASSFYSGHHSVSMHAGGKQTMSSGNNNQQQHVGFNTTAAVTSGNDLKPYQSSDSSPSPNTRRRTKSVAFLAEDKNNSATGPALTKKTSLGLLGGEGPLDITSPSSSGVLWSGEDQEVKIDPTTGLPVSAKAKRKASQSFGRKVSLVFTPGEGDYSSEDDSNDGDDDGDLERYRRQSSASATSEWGSSNGAEQFIHHQHRRHIQPHLTDDEIAALISNDYDRNDEGVSHLRTYLEQVYSNIDATRMNQISWQTFTAFLIDGIAGVMTTVGDQSSDPESIRKTQEKLKKEIMKAELAKRDRRKGRGESRRRREDIGLGDNPAEEKLKEVLRKRKNGEQDDDGSDEDGQQKSGKKVIGDDSDQVSYVFRGEQPVFSTKVNPKTSHEWYHKLRFVNELDKMMCVSRHRINYVTPGVTAASESSVAHTVIEQRSRISSAEYVREFDATITASLDQQQMRIYQHHSKNSPKQVYQFSLGFHDDTCVTCLMWVPDEKRMWGGTRSGKVFTFDITRENSGAYGSKPGKIMHIHQSVVTKLFAIPHGGGVVSASLDGTVRIYDKTGGGRDQTLRSHKLGVTAVSFSDHGNVLLTGGFDDKVLVWAENLWDAPVFTITDNVKPFVGNIVDICSIPSTPYVALADSSGTLKVYDLRQKDIVVFSMNVLDSENIAQNLIRREQVRSDQSSSAVAPTSDPQAAKEEALLQAATQLQQTGLGHRQGVYFASMAFSGSNTRQFWLGGGRVFFYGTTAEVRENPFMTYDKSRPVVNMCSSSVLGLVTHSPYEATIWSMKNGLPDCRHRRLTATKITTVVVRDGHDMMILGHASGLISAAQMSSGLQLQLYMNHEMAISCMTLHDSEPMLVTISNQELKMCVWEDENVFAQDSVPVVQPSNRRHVPKQSLALPMPASNVAIHPKGDVMMVCLHFQIAIYTYNPDYKRWVVAKRIRHGSTSELQGARFLAELQLQSLASFGFDRFQQREDDGFGSTVSSRAGSFRQAATGLADAKNVGSVSFISDETEEPVMVYQTPSSFPKAGSFSFGSQAVVGGTAAGGSNSSNTGALQRTTSQSSTSSNSAFASQPRSARGHHNSDDASAAALDALAPFSKHTIIVIDNRGRMIMWGLKADCHNSNCEYQLLSMWNNIPVNYLTEMVRSCILDQMRSHLKETKAMMNVTTPMELLEEKEEEVQKAKELRKQRHKEELELLAGTTRSQGGVSTGSDQNVTPVINAIKVPLASIVSGESPSSANLNTTPKSSSSLKEHPTNAKERRAAEKVLQKQTTTEVFTDMDQQLAQAIVDSSVAAAVAPPLRTIAVDRLYPFLVYTGDDLGRITCWYIPQLDEEAPPPISLLKNKMSMHESPHRGNQQHRKNSTASKTSLGRSGSSFALNRSNKHGSGAFTPGNASGRGARASRKQRLTQLNNQSHHSLRSPSSSSLFRQQQQQDDERRRNSQMGGNAGLSAEFGSHPDPLVSFSPHTTPIVNIAVGVKPFHSVITCGQDNVVVISTWYGQQLGKLQQGPLVDRQWYLSLAVQQMSKNFRARFRWLRLRFVVLGGVHRLMEKLLAANDSETPSESLGSATPFGSPADETAAGPLPTEKAQNASVPAAAVLQLEQPTKLDAADSPVDETTSASARVRDKRAHDSLAETPLQTEAEGGAPKALQIDVNSKPESQDHSTDDGASTTPNVLDSVTPPSSLPSPLIVTTTNSNNPPATHAKRRTSTAMHFLDKGALNQSQKGGMSVSFISPTAASAAAISHHSTNTGEQQLDASRQQQPQRERRFSTDSSVVPLMENSRAASMFGESVAGDWNMNGNQEKMRVALPKTLVSFDCLKRNVGAATASLVAQSANDVEHEAQLLSETEADEGGVYSGYDDSGSSGDDGDESDLRKIKQLHAGSPARLAAERRLRNKKQSRAIRTGGGMLSMRKKRLGYATHDELLAETSKQHGVDVKITKKRIKKRENKSDAIIDKLHNRPEQEDCSEPDNSASESSSGDDALEAFVKKHFNHQKEQERPIAIKKTMTEAEKKEQERLAAEQKKIERDERRRRKQQARNPNKDILATANDLLGGGSSGIADMDDDGTVLGGVSDPRATQNRRQPRNTLPTYTSPLPASVTPQPLNHPGLRYRKVDGDYSTDDDTDSEDEELQVRSMGKALLPDPREKYDGDLDHNARLKLRLSRSQQMPLSSPSHGGANKQSSSAIASPMAMMTPPPREVLPWETGLHGERDHDVDAAKQTIHSFAQANKTTPLDPRLQQSRVSQVRKRLEEVTMSPSGTMVDRSLQFSGGGLSPFASTPQPKSTTASGVVEHLMAKHHQGTEGGAKTPEPFSKNTPAGILAAKHHQPPHGVQRGLMRSLLSEASPTNEVGIGSGPSPNSQVASSLSPTKMTALAQTATLHGRRKQTGGDPLSPIGIPTFKKKPGGGGLNADNVSSRRLSQDLKMKTAIQQQKKRTLF